MSTRPPLISHLYSADPSAHVFAGRIFLYPSHDLDQDAVENDNGDQYRMEDYHVFSQPDPLGPVTDHGQVLHLRDVPWAERQLWAPDAAYRDGTYYLYFPARDRDGAFRIGVATAPKPEGPFRAEPQPIPGSFSIDPCVFADVDGEFYLYFGGVWGGQLQCWTTGSFVPDAKMPPPEAPALHGKVARLTRDMQRFAEAPQDVVVLDEKGGVLRSGDIERRYFEGPWVHRYRDTYYYSYSTGDGHTIVYGTAPSPLGPFQFRGTILTPVLGWTTHHSIVEHHGRWWLYYHDASLSGGISYKRSVKVQELFYEPDGSIRTMQP